MLRASLPFRLIFIARSSYVGRSASPAGTGKQPPPQQASHRGTGRLSAEHPCFQNRALLCCPGRLHRQSRPNCLCCRNRSSLPNCQNHSSFPKCQSHSSFPKCSNCWNHRDPGLFHLSRGPQRHCAGALVIEVQIARGVKGICLIQPRHDALPVDFHDDAHPAVLGIAPILKSKYSPSFTSPLFCTTT